MKTRLELAAVSKKYGRHIVLNQVWLQVRSGETVGLVGNNGVGKTTLIRIAAGLVRPDAGCVRWGEGAMTLRYFGAEGRAGTSQSTELRLTSDADVRHAASPDRRVPPPPDRDVTMAMTYFPGSTVASQAGVVPLRPGEERSGVDFALQLVPTARIEGSVALPEGGTPAATEVSLISLGPTVVPGAPFESFRTIRVAADGGFQFGNTAPGQYRLLARAARPITNPDGSAGPAQILWASVDLAIEGERVTGLTLSLEPGLSISGHVRFEGHSLRPPADLRSIRVSAVPDTEGSVALAPGLVSVGSDGRFSIAGVTPGRYRLNASFPGSGRAVGWQLKSIVANGQDALDASMELQPNQRVVDATITFTDRLAQLKGTLQSRAGALAADYSVVLFPVNPSLWIPQSRRIQSVRPAADGAFVFLNVPSGGYLLAAVEDVEPGEWHDPAFLQRITPAAVRVPIHDGEQKTQDLVIGRR